MRDPRMNGFCLMTFLAILGVLSRVAAMIPPHPSSDLARNATWIPVQQYRRKLGTTLEREPKVLNPELCKYEEEEICHHMDRSLQDQAHRTLELVKRQGSLKVLVILMQFSNHQDRDVVDTNDISTLFNSEERDSDIVPTGSVKTYLRMNSHDKLEIDALVVPWRTVDFTEQECLFGNSGLSRDFQKCFWPILDLLDRLHVDPQHPFDWVDYDVNADGFIDSVVVMHSGYGAEWGQTDPNGNTYEDRIWSHSVGPQEERWKSSTFLIDLGSYCVTSVFRSFEGNRTARIGLIVHEMIHTLGLPDLFDLSREDQEGGVGSYSVMSDPWGQGDDSTFPGHLDPWSKYQLGWIEPKAITSSGLYTMKPSELEPDIYMIDDAYPDGEYLLIEHRQPLRFDQNLWTKGALVWHIDDKVTFNTQAGGPFQGSEWPANGKHYQVALVQADGKFELEQAVNKGHAADFYTGGSSLTPGNSGSVYPNTDSYQTGIVQETGITLSDFSIDGFDLTFRVSGMAELPPPSTTSPLPEVPQAPVPAPDPTKCLVNINAGLCERHMQEVTVDEDCDCYNFCGNGIGQRCCKFGETCNIHCHAGGLIAGCQPTELSGRGNPDFETVGAPDFFLGETRDESASDGQASFAGAGNDQLNLVYSSAAQAQHVAMGGLAAVLFWALQ